MCATWVVTLHIESPNSNQNNKTLIRTSAHVKSPQKARSTIETLNVAWAICSSIFKIQIWHLKVSTKSEIRSGYWKCCVLPMCKFSTRSTSYSRLCKNDKYDIYNSEQCRILKPQNLSDFSFFVQPQI
jgi:hypothetical protein